MGANINEKAMRGTGTFLERRGMKILDTDWAQGKSKIDFVAKDEDKLVFIFGRIQPNEGKGVGDEPAGRESARTHWTARKTWQGSTSWPAGTGGRSGVYQPSPQNA